MKRKTKVILITITLVAIITVGVPAFLKARAQSQRSACINNLRILTAPMMCCVPMAKRLTIGDKLDPKEVCQYIKGNTMPVCPAGGTYIVTWEVGGATPKCSVHGDVFWDLYHVKTLEELEELEYRSEKAGQTSEGDSSTRTARVTAPPLREYFRWLKPFGLFKD
jgi:hypothetical protein